MTHHRFFGQYRLSRLLILVVIGSFLALASAPASAVSLYAAYWDTNDLGEAGGIGIGFSFGGKFTVDIAGTYYEELDEDPFDLLVEGGSPFADGGLEVIPLDAGVTWHSGTGRGGGFYLGAGVTLFMIDAEADGVEVDDEAGWYAKAGFDFGGGRGPSFFVEALLRQVDTEVGADFGFLDGGSAEIDLEGISLHVGVRF